MNYTIIQPEGETLMTTRKNKQRKRILNQCILQKKPILGRDIEPKTYLCGQRIAGNKEEIAEGILESKLAQ